MGTWALVLEFLARTHQTSCSPTGEASDRPRVTISGLPGMHRGRIERHGDRHRDDVLNALICAGGPRQRRGFRQPVSDNYFSRSATIRIPDRPCTSKANDNYFPDPDDIGLAERNLFGYLSSPVKRLGSAGRNPTRILGRPGRRCAFQAAPPTVRGPFHCYRTQSYALKIQPGPPFPHRFLTLVFPGPRSIARLG